MPDDHLMVESESYTSVTESKWRPEALFLLTLLRPSTTNGDLRANELTATEKFDWDWFQQQVLRHNVAGIVYGRLSEDSSAFPEPICGAISRMRKQIMQHNMARLQELRGLIQELTAKEIPVIPFKGPVLAGTYYDDLAERQYGDLDLMVRRDDLLRVKALLEDRNYVSYRDLSPSEEQDLIDHQLAYEFVRERDKLIVELHWALMHDIHSFRLRPETVWRKAETARLGGQTISTLATDDLIIYLAAHGSKHGWYRLLWACDMDRVVRAHLDVDWPTIHKRARRLGCARTLRLGLRVAHRWIGTPIPTELRREVERDTALPEMITHIEKHWLFSGRRPKDGPVAIRAPYLSKTRERWQDRWAYYKHVARILITPTEQDRAFLSLPSWLSFLYYGVRPFRLLYEWTSFSKQAKRES